MAKLRILIVDDHAVVRRGVRTLIEGHRGWTVAGEATTAAEGAAKARTLKAEVVLLDLGLPDVHGTEAINMIRQVRPEAQILVLTMHLSAGIATKVLAQGARGLVLKSDATSDLVRAVEALARGKAFVSPGVMEVIVKGLAESGKTLENNLTPRERQILKLLAEGRANKEVATALGLSIKTVEAHRANLMRKLDLRSLTELIHFAIRNHLVDL
ncbi:MAG: response regulator transcription factor [Acidobacteriia bacterium]|nr:response regulator transcription factor [Terriglobia bacterium]